MTPSGPFGPVVRRSAPRGTAAVAWLLCLVALAGCGGEEVRLQRVAFCQGSSGEAAEGGIVQIEFRQGTAVVARAVGARSSAFAVLVPLGEVQVYADGVLMGAMDGGGADGPYVPPAPGQGVYLHGDGCPEAIPS